MHPTTPEPGSRWAIVELMGRAAVAGLVCDDVIAGRTFLRVDVPEVCWTEFEYIDGQRSEQPRSIAAHTQYIGAEAIYRLTPVDQAAAQAMADRVRSRPLQAWDLRELLQQMPVHERRALLLPAMAPDSPEVSDEPF